MEKFFDFEKVYDINRDPETLTPWELYAHAELACRHSQLHPDGGFSIPEELSDEEVGDFMRRLSIAMLKLRPEFRTLSFEQRASMVSLLESMETAVEAANA